MKVHALAALFLLASCSDGGTEPEIGVSDAWVRATMAGQPSTAAYLDIANDGGGDRLVAVHSPVGEASLHSVTREGSIVRMRPIHSLDVPEGSTVRLSPGSDHVMLTGIETPLAPGSTVPLRLTFERSGERLVEAEVRAPDGAAR